jgi:hypothetical protein
MKHLNNGLLQKLNTLSKKKDIASAKETIALAKQIKAYSGSIKNFIGENYDDLVKRIPEQKLQAIIQYTDTKSGEMDVYIVKTKEAIDTAQTKVVQKTEPKKEDPAEAAPTAEQNTAVSQAKKEGVAPRAEIAVDHSLASALVVTDKKALHTLTQFKQSIRPLYDANMLSKIDFSKNYFTTDELTVLNDLISSNAQNEMATETKGYIRAFFGNQFDDESGKPDLLKIKSFLTKNDVAVVDAGLTQVEPGTNTVLGFYPVFKSKCPK